jgi:Poxvirus D5 protein-like
LAPLLGKPLAIVSDARLSGRGSQVVVERLLAISGEDTITVNRKYKEQWSGKLPSRFLVISNELPQFGDASAAIAGRFVSLLLTRSWYGEEDTGLEGAIHPELTGILNWALDGLARLERQGQFTKPASTDEAMIALQDLASPVGAFVRDRCEIDAGHEIAVDELWEAWKSWAEDNGHNNALEQQRQLEAHREWAGEARRYIRNNAVSSAKVADGSLLAGDFAAGQLPAGPKGDKGDKGDTGAEGTQAVQGEPGMSGYQRVVNFDGFAESLTFETRDVNCPVGKKVVGGGGNFENEDRNVAILESRALDDDTWRVRRVEVVETADLRWLDAYAVCVNVAP